MEEFKNKELRDIHKCVTTAYYSEIFARQKRLKDLDKYLESIKFKDDKDSKISDEKIKEMNKDSQISDEELKERIKKMGIVGW